jgi:hypothetical protein
MERLGNDEIWLGGFAIDAAGATQNLTPFEVYPHFDDGDIKEFRPLKTIFRLNVPGGGSFPKSCVATLVLAEKDSGDSGDLAALIEKMKDKMRVVWNDRFPPIETPSEFERKTEAMLKEVVLSVTGLDYDVFPAQVISLSISSDDFRWGDGTKMSPETTIEFRAHDGVYYLVYYWEIETLESSRPFHGGDVVITPPVGGGTLHP